MDWMSFIIFILACFGFTQILVYSKLLEPIRPKHHFFHCPLCMAFWVGMTTYVLFWFIDSAMFVLTIESIEFWLRTIIMGGVAAGTTYALSSIIGDDGINVKNN